MAGDSDLNHDASASSSTRSHHHHQHYCTPFTLPSNGVLVVNPTSTLTLSSNALFTPECRPAAAPTSNFALSQGISSISDVKDPFYASTTPQTYATGAATVISWMLLVMLLITPRTFFVGGAGGTFGLLGRRGIISGAQGSASVIGVGSRPWLQKVAALLVAISMTIATRDTFEVAARQYEDGFMKAKDLRAEVVGSNEIKISRLISDVFVWLALVQTLIRLFPRHREKVFIKWIGFALIILDATFTCLNNFVGDNPVGRPASWQDAKPALNYLFQLALSMLYAAWVIYYAFTKRRLAFYHSSMWNISLVAFLSIIAILTPIVFFITDISNQSVAGWGDYFRWVGAVAASVIVWEWVERIEALEREEKKDGILGREIFDVDDIQDPAPPVETGWCGNRHGGLWPKFRRAPGGGGDGPHDGGFSTDVSEKPREASVNGARTSGSRPDDRYRRPSVGRYHSSPGEHNFAARGRTGAVNDGATLGHSVITPPPAAVSPISRGDTGSAASTVYAVRYHSLHTPSSLVTHQESLQQAPEPMSTSTAETKLVQSRDKHAGITSTEGEQIPGTVSDRQSQSDNNENHKRWHNPLKRPKVLPPAEVRRGQVISPVGVSARKHPAHNFSKWDIKGRLGAFAAEQGEKFLEKKRDSEADVDLPVTIIPAQPRGRTWSPAVLSGPPSSRHQRQHADSDGDLGAPSSAATSSAPSTSIGPEDSEGSRPRDNGSPSPDISQQRSPENRRPGSDGSHTDSPLPR